MDDNLREKLVELKIKAWAYFIACEFGAVPDNNKLVSVLEVFGSESATFIEKAMKKYQGYSDTDLSSSIPRDLKNLDL